MNARLKTGIRKKMSEKEKLELDLAWLDRAIEDTATNLQVLIYERKEAMQKLKELMGA